jgi:hypothetical protein
MSEPIVSTLRRLQGGAFSSDCGDKLASVVKAVESTGKAGKLVITIDVAKSGAAVSIKATAVDKTPQELRDPDLFWSTPEGRLTEENPNQRKLDLQQIPTQARVVAGA